MSSKVRRSIIIGIGIWDWTGFNFKQFVGEIFLWIQHTVKIWNLDKIQSHRIESNFDADVYSWRYEHNTQYDINNIIHILQLHNKLWNQYEALASLKPT